MRPTRVFDVSGRARALSAIIGAMAEVKAAGLAPADPNAARMAAMVAGLIKGRGVGSTFRPQCIMTMETQLASDLCNPGAIRWHCEQAYITPLVGFAATCG